MTFANQALSVEFLARDGRRLEPSVMAVPREIDLQVARLKLGSLGVRIDTLTADQKRYLASWSEGS